MELRPYQIDISSKAANIITKRKCVLLAMEVRTGKTITSLETAKKIGSKNVLFITKKKAIESIKNDYNAFNYDFNLYVVNRESLHLFKNDTIDFLIIDEVHGYTSFPKPSKYYKDIKNRFGNLPMIFLSGTPTPESYSQFYHLFTLSNHHPFNEWVNFYKWAKKFVDVKIKNLGFAKVNDYSEARKSDFENIINPYILTFTQQQSGFQTVVYEQILKVEMKTETYKAIDLIKKNLFIKTSKGEIIADTSVKLQQKIHQLCSGTIKLEDGSYIITDNSKAEFIKNKFEHNKIAIFYNFKAELVMLKDIYGDSLTTNLNEFNNTDKNIAIQIVSGREGISLSKADFLVMFNIQFSSVSYFQSRDRLSTLNRKNNTIYWIFAKDGIENKIYNTVLSKKDYTNSIFKKDYGFSNEGKKAIAKRRF